MVPRGSRRRLAGLLAAMLTVTAVAMPVAARDDTRAAADGGETRTLRGRDFKPLLNPVATNTVGVRSDLGYQGDGFAWVVGEVWNRTAARREFIRVTATFYGPMDAVLGTAEDFVYLQRLASGASSPFLVEFEDPTAAAVEYSLAVDDGDVLTGAQAGRLTVVPGAVTDDGNFRTYTGEVRNLNAFPVTFADANVTLYDGAGNVVDVWWAYTTPDTIPAGGKGTYSVEFISPDTPPAMASVSSQGWRNGTDYVTSWDNYFDDIGTSIFRKDIIWLAEHGITAGCAAGRYCPVSNVRRDEMASFIARAVGLTAIAPNAFVDDNGNTHEININRIKAAGITSGCNAAARLYCPAANVKRDEMASFMARALKIGTIAPNAFVDDNGNVHEVNINRIAAAGVTTGCNVAARLYCPADNVTRGQMAAFLRRAFD
jgi:hypothetical protein